MGKDNNGIHREHTFPNMVGEWSSWCTGAADLGNVQFSVLGWSFQKSSSGQQLSIVLAITLTTSINPKGQKLTTPSAYTQSMTLYHQSTKILQQSPKLYQQPEAQSTHHGLPNAHPTQQWHIHTPLKS
jgi:hypothetical protein